MDLKEQLEVRWRANVLLYRFTITFIIIALIFYLLFALYSVGDVRRQRAIAETQEKGIINIQRQFIEMELERIISDLRYLSNAGDLSTILSTPEVGLEDQNYAFLVEQWKIFLQERKVYNTISLLNSAGQYVLGIRGEHGSPLLSVCPPEQSVDCPKLQGIREHMDEPVYISEIQVSTNKDLLEEPIIPILRVSIPVYNEEGDVLGAVFVDYLAQHIIAALEEISQSSNGEFSLLNSNGYWLSSEDASREWGFIYEDQANTSFAWHHPMVWKNIVEQHEGYYYAYEGLYVFSTLDLRQLMLNYITDERSEIEADYTAPHLIIVSFLSASQALYFGDWPTLSLITAQLFKEWPIYLGLSLLFTVIINLILYQSNINRAQLRFFAIYDTLTGAYNRHYGLALLQRDYTRHINTGERFYLAFVDVNGLKEVNDALGHEKGDELLKTVVQVIDKHLATGNYIIRMGGDEFLIHLHDISDEGIANIQQKVISDLNAINEQEGRPYLISIGWGNSQFDYERFANLDELICQADALMYQNKVNTKKVLKSVLR